MRSNSFFFVAIAAAVAVQSAVAHAAPRIRDGSHDMDFSIGSWTTEITMIKDPFDRPDELIHMTGTKVARPIWNGKALIEEIEADGPGGHWEAANLFLYDPMAGQWSQNYVDSSVGRMEAPSIGGYRNGNLEFYSQEFIGGRALLIVIRRHRRLIETDQQQDRGRSRQPWQHARCQRQEFGGIGEVDQRHGILIVVSGGAGNAAWFVSYRLRES